MEKTIRQLLADATKRFKEGKISTPRLDAEVILAHQLGRERIDFITKSNEIIDITQQKIYDHKIQERLQGKPVQYITGQQEFMGLTFGVTPDVLIPRADTEILVEAVLEHAKSMEKPLAIVDIGTGSGAICLSLAYYILESIVHTVDISEKALEVAQQNAKKLCLKERVHFYIGNLLAPLETKLMGKIDLLVSNPPYIPHEDIAHLQKEVRHYEPMLALDGGEDGLGFYRDIIEQGSKLLSPQGKIFFEVGYNQAQEVADMLKTQGMFEEIEIKKDLAGIDRVVIGTIKKEN